MFSKKCRVQEGKNRVELNVQLKFQSDEADLQSRTLLSQYYYSTQSSVLQNRMVGGLQRWHKSKTFLQQQSSFSFGSHKQNTKLNYKSDNDQLTTVTDKLSQIL